MADMFEAVAWVDVDEDGDIVDVHPIRRTNAENQTIITLSDGQQVAIWGADLTGARFDYRRTPGSTWTGDVRRGTPHGRPVRPTVHHGEW